NNREKKAAGPTTAPPPWQEQSVFFAGYVGGVENFVGPMAAGLSQILVVNLDKIGIFVGAAEGFGGVVPIEGAGPQGLQVHKVADAGRLDGLAAAVDTAAGA